MLFEKFVAKLCGAHHFVMVVTMLTLLGGKQSIFYTQTDRGTSKISIIQTQSGKATTKDIIRMNDILWKK